MPDAPAPVPPPFSKVRLPPLPADLQVVCHAILADGALVALATDVDLAGEHQRIFTAWQASSDLDPPSRLNALAADGAAKLWTATPSGWQGSPTFPLETPFPMVDRFADGRWLVVATRSLGDTNARVLAPGAALLARLMLGDGIEDVAIDAEDRIWVGWFDEGMFGNRDWAVPGHEWPPSGNGVACFAPDGELLPLPTWPAEAGPIADCYALNVAGPGAWACPYTEFPLVRFVPGEPARWWRNALAGPKAIATDGAYALLAGGYREEASRVALVALPGPGQGEDAVLLASWQLPLRRLPAPENDWAPVWDQPTLLVGRGDTLHLVDGGVWHRWRVADLLAAI
jgi:hypothetical protein